MLVEYLDNSSKEIKEIKKKARELKKKYDEILDRDILVELHNLNRKLKIKKHSIWETIYENINEFRYMKKYFPQLFDVYMEDDNIGRIMEKKKWLAEFKELEKNEAEREIKRVTENFRKMKKMRNSLGHWPHDKEIFDGMSLEELDLTRNDDKVEVQEKLDDEIRKIRTVGWKIILNDPLILGYVNRFVERLKKAVKEENEAKKKLEQSNGQGTYWEYKAKQEYDKALRKRKKAEMLTKHLLMANPKFFEKFKNQNIFWRDRDISAYMARFLKEINIPKINEKEWINEMKEKIE